MESMASTAEDLPYSSFWALFTQPARLDILLRVSYSRLTYSTPPDVVLDVLFEITIAYIKDRNVLPGCSKTVGETMAHMGLSPLFQAEIISSQRVWRAPLVDEVESMLRWRFTGLRTLLDLARQPSRMAASLANKTIEVEDDEPICGICRDKKAVGDVVKILRCGHWFDDDCLESWLCMRNSCPACRATAVDLDSQLAIPW